MTDINGPPGDSPIGREFLEKLLYDLARRAAARTPTGEDPVQFGKDLAAQALAEAWGWLLRYPRKSERDLEQTAHWLLTKRLLDEDRKTGRRLRTESIQALEEEREADSLEELVSDESLPDELAERRDLIQVVRNAVAALSGPHREVLELRFWHKLTNEQIGKMLGISQRQVIRRYQAAEQALKFGLRRFGIKPNH